MSTKTSIKRIAAVAAVALTLGGFSAVSASAADEAVTGIAISNAVQPASATASTTLGTTTAPVTATVLANSTVHLDVQAAITGAVVKSCADSTFGTCSTSISSTATATSNVGTGEDFAFTAASTATTTYYRASFGTSTTYAYFALKTVRLLATTYDGKIGGIGAAAVNGVAGPSNTVTLTVAEDSSLAGFISVSGAGASIASYLSGSTAAVTPAAGVLSAKVAANSNTTGAVVVNTPTAGTVTVTYAPETAAGSGIAGAVTDTITITVNATGSAGVLSVANSTMYDTITVAATHATLAGALTPTTALGLATASSSTPVALYTWALKDVLSSAYALTTTTKGSVVVSGPGLLSTTSNNSASAAKALSISSGSTGDFYLYGDGTSGVATITFSVGATTIATKTFNFYSTTVAKLTATVDNAILNKAAVTGFTAPVGTHGTVDYISVVAADANGNSIPSLTNLTASSSNTSVLTTGIPVWDTTDLVYYVPVTGVAAGTATVTVKDASGLISATGSLTVSNAVIDSWTVAFDADTYNAGDAAKLLITAKDSTGAAVADGKYTAVLSGKFATSQSTTSDLFAADVTFVGGVATAKFYAPYGSGTFTVSGYVGSSTTVLSKALQAIAAAATAQKATATITSATDASTQAAIDAAQEATDAANAAYDAANNAMDSADAATAAAQDASDNASAALAAVTSLSATVAKLVKSVAAIAAALAKVQKKIGA